MNPYASLTDRPHEILRVFRTANARERSSARSLHDLPLLNDADVEALLKLRILQRVAGNPNSCGARPARATARD